MPPDDFSEKIELLVNDENKIVTYKVLSNELKIHVNKAKQCLMDFLNAQKSKGNNFVAHYFLSGFVEIDGIRSIKVIIVPEDNLENAKKSFSEINSFHIYSVYKAAAHDECSLYSADILFIKGKEELTKYSAIKHPNIEIQPPVLNKIYVNNNVKSNVTKKGVPHVSPSVNSSVSPKNEPKIPQNGVSPEKGDSKEQVKVSTDNKTSPEKEKKQKAGTLMSMWQKKEEKNSAKKEAPKAETKAKTSKAVPKNNIMSMFSKQAEKNTEKPPVSKPPVSKAVESSKSIAPDVVQKEDSPKKNLFNENKKSAQKRKAPSRNSKESFKSRRDSDSENEFQPKGKKKHRRICTFDSSESESEPEEEREKAQRNFFQPEEPVEAATESGPLTEDEEPIPPTPPVIHTKGRVRMWKTVQKTYEDEDGFLVTKSVKELVSASEDEEEPIKLNNVKKEEIVTKKNTSVNKKQASLMSFFKQK